MKRLILPAVLMLTACGQSAGEEAEARYRMVEKNTLATYGERCRVARTVADAYLKEGAQQKYELWQLTARNDCDEDAGALGGS